MSLRLTTVALLATLLWLGPAAGLVAGQENSTAANDEDIEPRVIGQKGTTAIGIAGFIDRFYSREETLPGHYTLQVDVARFIAKKLAVRAGIAGTGRFGVEAADDDETGPGAPSLHARTGVLFYFTPRSIASVYLGTEYWMQVTKRAPGDAGVVVGTAGIQAAVSSRASVFMEAGLGAGLTRGSEGGLLTRVVGQIGLRIGL